jgi:hypothetical protein
MVKDIDLLLKWSFASKAYRDFVEMVKDDCEARGVEVDIHEKYYGK